VIDSLDSPSPRGPRVSKKNTILQKPRIGLSVSKKSSVKFAKNINGELYLYIYIILYNTVDILIEKGNIISRDNIFKFNNSPKKQ
jgi:hypothetical protein